MIKSQRQIRANYQAINQVFSENHVAMNQEFQGMHNSLTFRIQANPTTSATQIALFTKLVNSAPMLFFAPSSSQTPIQLTYNSISTGLQSTNPNVYKSDQYSFIPGPFIVYGGLITGATNGMTKTLTPTSTLLFVATQTVFKSAANNEGNSTNILGSSFTITLGGSSATQNIYYFAIGKP